MPDIERDLLIKFDAATLDTAETIAATWREVELAKVGVRQDIVNLAGGVIGFFAFALVIGAAVGLFLVLNN